MKIKLLIVYLFVCSVAHAESFVCFDPVTKRVVSRQQGDCYLASFCSGLNNTGVRSDCIIATTEEYAKAADKLTKYDSSVSSGSRIVDLSQSEKDAIIAAEAQAITEAEAARVSALDTKISAAKVSDATLTKIDTAIDNISSLADAKVFLKKLARYLVMK